MWRQLTFAVILLVSAACSRSKGSVQLGGTEVCLGCRVKNEIVLTGKSRRIEDTLRNQCSEWVAAQVENHQHLWSTTGCWFSESGVACSIGPFPGDNDWLGFLKALPAEDIRRMTELGDYAEYKRAVGEYWDWKAN